VKNETIVDRVVERLKAQPLGDLITEEDLHEIVKEAIPKVFFEKRKVVEGSGYHQSTKEIEPLIVEVMRGLLQESARAAVQTWLTSHAEVMADHWKTVIDAGLLDYVQKIQNEIATTQVKAALGNLLNQMNTERQKMGLMPVFI
jgi:hypothetical protein